MRIPSLQTSLLLTILICSALVDGRLYCFRRLKRRGRCGGMIRHTRYTDAAHCCGRRGQGFAEVRVKLGRNRFRCTPCSKLLDQSPALSPFTPSSPSSNRKRKISRRKIRNRAPPPPTSTTPATTTTTTSQFNTSKFVWPTPARRDFGAYEFPRSRADGGDVIVWQSWSPCSVSCGAGWRSRAKVCDGCDHNDYENVQSQPCMDRFYCPVDGTWGPWQPWGICSTTCNEGTRTRTRKCNYPPPAYGGAYCEGDAVAKKDCNLEHCPVDGEWGPWSALSACSATCGPGQSTRTRRCDSPAPLHGGRDCPGQNTTSQRCEVVRCPVHGSWSVWSVWGACSVTCGLGVREQMRSCDSPAPQHGGNKCQGPARTHQQCYANRPCPVHGGWAEWAMYGRCRARRCTEGSQVRVRACNSPRPAYGGRPCGGQQYDRVSCFNDHDCPQNGTWCPWSGWNSCSASCAGGQKTPIRARQRHCACPETKHGGRGCDGDELEVQECEDVPTCHSAEDPERSNDEASKEKTTNPTSPTSKIDGVTAPAVRSEDGAARNPSREREPEDDAVTDMTSS